MRGARLLRRAVKAAALLLCLAGVSTSAAGPPADPSTPALPAPSTGPTDEVTLAVYLPGLYFTQISARVQLGEELAAHLSQALGRRTTARVYATAESLESDAARLSVALVEAPYAAARLHLLTPLCVATADGREETKLVILSAASGPVRGAEDLRQHRLAYAALAFEEQAFLSNFVFEGDLQLSREHLEPGRDASSALSKVSLKKAEAVLLYEDDRAQALRAGLRVIYETAPLPRPTLVVFDKNQDEAQVQRLREAMARFSGKVHPQLRSFKPAIADRYLSLRWQMQRRSPRLPPLLELLRDGSNPTKEGARPPADDLHLPGLSAAPPGPLPAPSLRSYLP